MITAKLKSLSLLPIIILLASFSVNAQTKKDEPFTIENYYKVKWGYADEFIDLWKTNHYPLLKKAIEKFYIDEIDDIYWINEDTLADISSENNYYRSNTYFYLLNLYYLYLDKNKYKLINKNIHIFL